MSAKEKTFKQRAVGKFVFHGRAVDNIMPHALNHIATSKDTKNAPKAVRQFLDCAGANPNARIIHRASDMIV